MHAHCDAEMGPRRPRVKGTVRMRKDAFGRVLNELLESVSEISRVKGAAIK